MLALPAHGEVAAEDGGGWRRGTKTPPGTRGIYANQTNGRRRCLAEWDSRFGRWEATDFGKDYYAHNRIQIIVNVPAILYNHSAAAGYVACTIGHGGPPVRSMIPFDFTIPDL